MGCAMHKPNSEPLGQGTDRTRLATLYRDHHRLLIMGYMIRVRLGGLRALLMLLSPFLTPGLLTMLHRWFEDLRGDVTEFSRRCRAFRMELRAQPRRFQNPWV